MMRNRVRSLVCAGVVTLVSVAASGAQTVPVPPTPPAAPAAPSAPPQPTIPVAPVPVSVAARPISGEMRRIDLVLSRWVGDKRIESLPFSALLAAPSGNDMVTGRVRLGVDVPTGRTRSVKTDQGVTTDQVTTYLGTNIDLFLREPGGGVFDLSVTLAHTMLTPALREPRLVAQSTDPATKTISFTNRLALREGRTIQISSAADAITGETARLEVTVATVK